jgi:uncharacterized glyoxalase superfamily protein PhnB
MTAAGENDAFARATEVSAEEVRAHTLSPYLAVNDARRAIEWYADVLGARRLGQAFEMEDGRIGHVELVIGDSVLMMADEYPEIGMLSPVSRGGVSVAIHVQVADVDAAVDRARQRGATVVGEAEDKPYGRSGQFEDPFGHRWLVLTPPEGQPLPAAEPERPRHGDIAYVTIATPDGARARDFYAAVLGWTTSAGSVENGWTVDGAEPMTGIWGGQDSDVLLCFRVDDLPAALTRVRDGGGRAGEPEPKPYGLLASCVDDQGRHFQLWSPSA